MLARRVALLLVVVAAASCALGTRRERVAVRWQRALGDGLCEAVYRIDRPPAGEWDYLGVHRLARCDDTETRAPVVFYLPGTYMNGALPGDAPEVRRLLAGAGVHVWSVDYRTHAVPSDASEDELQVLATWTSDVFADDAEAASVLARSVDAGPFYVAGFSFGAGVAYRLAARDLSMDGLVILDGMPPDGRVPGGDGPAVDVGGGRIPYPVRQRLLAAVLKDPASASPLVGFATAGDALADVTFTARSFGGAGGLSAAKNGVTDVRDVAALLATYDRWWPRAVFGGTVPVPSRRVRVLAFTSTTIGREWVDRVRAGTVAFGGPDAVVHELAGHGHLDVLIGRDVAKLVADPIRAFVGAR